MKAVALIPARYDATRFPGKLMAKLGSKSVILRTYESTVNTGLFEEVYVVTDSDIIFEEITASGGKAIKSQKEHECGSDRIAEAAEKIEADIIVNVQGDEPFTKKEPLVKLLEVFEGEDAKEIDLASLMQVLTKVNQIEDPNYVKVVVDQNNFAMFFSRSPIPYPRNKAANAKYYEHIGVYAFRKQALLDFYNTPMTILEDTEKIECLRYLETGKKIKMVETEYMGIEIDTPEDLENAKTFIED
ncbi:MULTISPECIES: 3-deoxy-manno-octulosonate cytidylyltransferase [Roseivirga]|jgi:3-deoxy-D-manno-octulosonate cytidylyltransferase|uniref:3-deoxy-manno-octulosonate cytidylyltransferase n=1 Tax=Roseivirga spongicola TaxID=333140 RepID=A0A150X3K9_9BACT|nr:MULTISPECIES: 3-deoxy-manno-octulosonate cytidylyltransferase [Roseivirga]PWL28549.1 MAG: 3-deoxy-manno-octulosonate cytidylyltransferase [Roseivirga sp. XM-24bin3]KYG73293.1 3-deoxy-manno-octulosonate cytidylyltransferase [Roseivirga spongicola]MBO6497420.1 3-deoxy-manno-octulosonate cytidylyltransferase [Roseivirga sp.]MBO6659517.1 3-deoxy-manno-octulosonate cytidylyltransferase [Roseivirga sp.]MBO6760555.1 3-deoxy-manno-octulosonate cytidylyltransferase [Roseivirga sp.]